MELLGYDTSAFDAMYNVIKNSLFSSGQSFHEEPIENVIALFVICSIVMIMIMSCVVIMMMLLTINNKSTENDLEAGFF
ncbi:uncharacterized protein GVI51_I00363 [Nakaseomyces glabratus]|uniref:Uncharacterized protein n=2 Tax=Candida glabrata TaxID=5478 RepID=Q6FR67_CANGA|nr:uncharacterized protein CAGL0I00550g [Nakaseomyces glabratus]KAH7580549.1 hypothetical protein J7296_03915 [Nakaseomyces glabratus]KAH7585587.1 hypothetical protein J7298_02552 [Nakaseomyces glabratus]KAH7587275.1 hypothetical protein J7297_02549 [Nakaseomyces glabratus]KAH7599219.1 hypothetical protein J7295_02559 [Nakaseomyces glabratus]KAH7599533.1 hypothetical protein J7294_02548 [Nakaseomyces glabratus]|eukprot:XP_447277.1 uncharacterized protein CAGL0I00550g [[Candida] glabrata]